MKSILFCVSSDVVTDQRVLRHCNTLINNGYKVHVIARKTQKSLALPDLPFKVTRFSMLFKTGPLFYICFNLRLFFFMVFQPSYMIWSNDLDTLVPCYLIKRIKGKKLVFDAHELFTEVPELENKPFKKSIWKWVERAFVSKADLLITVNDSLSAVFKSRYELTFNVIRNVPKTTSFAPSLNKESLGIQQGTLVCILQGSGLNTGRGLIETVEAFKTLEKVVLFVIGSGNALDAAKNYCKLHGLDDRIRFIPRLPYHEMMSYTQLADVGLAYDTHPCMNFQLALPNKIFDYFQAGVAVLCGPQPEIQQLVEKYCCGRIMQQVTPDQITQNLQYFQENPMELESLKKNSLTASHSENWDLEEQKLIRLLKGF